MPRREIRLYNTRDVGSNPLYADCYPIPSEFLMEELISPHSSSTFPTRNTPIKFVQICYNWRFATLINLTLNVWNTNSNILPTFNSEKRKIHEIRKILSHISHERCIYLIPEKTSGFLWIDPIRIWKLQKSAQLTSHRINFPEEERRKSYSSRLIIRYLSLYLPEPVSQPS